MRRIALLILLAFLCGSASADDPFITRGLSARLIIVPVSNPLPEGPLYRVRLELVNLGVEGSAGTVPIEIRLSLMAGDLHLKVVDEDGREVPRSMRTEDRLVSPWRVELPPEGRVDFPIGEGGDQPYRGWSGKLLTFGLGSEWAIPSDGKHYYLAGTLREERGAGWRDPRPDNVDEWMGSAEIAKVPLH